MNILRIKYAKRSFLLFAFLLFATPYCFSQYWERNLGSPETLEYIYNFDESYDKGYILGTILIDEISPNFQEFTISSFIYKTDINGDTLWYRNFRHDPLLVYSCRDVGDGTTVALFSSYDYNNNCSRIFITRIDECGNKMWCIDIFDYLGYGYGSGDMEIINNRIVFCRENYNPAFDSKFDILMYDLDGHKICEKPFLFYEDHPFMNSPFLFKLLPLPNNEFMMLGRAYYKANPTGRAWLRALFVKFDAEGNEQWALPYGLNDTIISLNQNCENVVIQETTGHYFAFSCTYSNIKPLELLLMKFDESGNEKGYVISNIDTINNKGYSPYFAGSIKVANNEFYTPIIFSLPDDPNHKGNICAIVDSTISEFLDTIPLQGYQLQFLKMIKTFDGKYLTCGYEAPYDEIQAYLNKVSIDPLSFDTMYTMPYTYDSLCTEEIVYADTIYFDDCLYVGNNELQYKTATEYPIHIYPNPTQDELTISLGALSYVEPITITIHTLTGDVKWQGILPPGEQTKRLSVYSWPQGIYIVTAKKDKEVVGREKIVVM